MPRHKRMAQRVARDLAALGQYIITRTAMERVGLGLTNTALGYSRFAATHKEGLALGFAVVGGAMYAVDYRAQLQMAAKRKEIAAIDKQLELIDAELRAAPHSRLRDLR